VEPLSTGNAINLLEGGDKCSIQAARKECRCKGKLQASQEKIRGLLVGGFKLVKGASTIISGLNGKFTNLKLIGIFTTANGGIAAASRRKRLTANDKLPSSTPKQHRSHVSLHSYVRTRHIKSKVPPLHIYLIPAKPRIQFHLLRTVLATPRLSGTPHATEHNETCTLASHIYVISTVLSKRPQHTNTQPSKLLTRTETKYQVNGLTKRLPKIH
jgi:hypothetical protein